MKLLTLLTILLLPLSVMAGEATRKLTIRAFLNDPTRMGSKCFVHDSPETLAPLQLVPGELPVEQTVTVLNDRLSFYDAAAIDPSHPAAAEIASVAVHDTLKHAIVIIQPLDNSDKPAYGIILIDDSVSAFPLGESRVVSLTSLSLAIQAGEHKLQAESGKITRVPPVAQMDAYNMAQTNLYYQGAAGWIPFNETKIKYLKSYRYIFICFVKPGGKTPLVSTIVDDAPVPEAQAASK